MSSCTNRFEYHPDRVSVIGGNKKNEFMELQSKVLKNRFVRKVCKAHLYVSRLVALILYFIFPFPKKLLLIYIAPGVISEIFYEVKLLSTQVFSNMIYINDFLHSIAAMLYFIVPYFLQPPHQNLSIEFNHFQLVMLSFNQLSVHSVLFFDAFAKQKLANFLMRAANVLCVVVLLTWGYFVLPDGNGFFILREDNYWELVIQIWLFLLMFLNVVFFLVFTNSHVSTFRDVNKRVEEKKKGELNLLKKFSHVIRTVLTGIVVQKEDEQKSLKKSFSFDDGNIPSEITSVELMKLCVAQIRRIVGDLLDYSMIRLNKKKMEGISGFTIDSQLETAIKCSNSEFDLNEALENALEVESTLNKYQGRHRNEKDEKEESLSPVKGFGEGIGKIVKRIKKLPKQVIGDRVKFVQIISNVVSNAVKYTQTGRKVIVSCSFDYSENTLEFVCEDEGDGMDGSQMKRIKDGKMFIEGMGNLPGTGVGLALTHTLVELMRGKIEIEVLGEKESSGTRVSISLPLIPKLMKPTELKFDEEIPGMEILVIDDSMIARMILPRQIKSISPESVIETSNHGADAWRKMRETNYCPQAIFCDLDMPVMRGEEFCQLLRGIRDYDNIICAAFTAGSPGAINKEEYCEKYGFDLFLDKPLPMKTLRLALIGMYNVIYRGESKSENFGGYSKTKRDEPIHDEVEELKKQARLISKSCEVEKIEKKEETKTKKRDWVKELMDDDYAVDEYGNWVLLDAINKLKTKATRWTMIRVILFIVIMWFYPGLSVYGGVLAGLNYMKTREFVFMGYSSDFISDVLKLFAVGFTGVFKVSCLRFFVLNYPLQIAKYEREKVSRGIFLCALSIFPTLLHLLCQNTQMTQYQYNGYLFNSFIWFWGSIELLKGTHFTYCMISKQNDDVSKAVNELIDEGNIQSEFIYRCGMMLSAPASHLVECVEIKDQYSNDVFVNCVFDLKRIVKNYLVYGMYQNETLHDRIRKFTKSSYQADSKAGYDLIKRIKFNVSVFPRHHSGITINVENEVNPDSKEVVLIKNVDEQMMEVLVMNLISNALERTDITRKVEIKILKKSKGELILKVKNYVKIAKIDPGKFRNLEKWFEPFDHTGETARASPKMHLGLYCCSIIAKMLWDDRARVGVAVGNVKDDDGQEFKWVESYLHVFGD